MVSENLLHIKWCVSMDVSCDDSFILAPSVSVTTSAIRAAVNLSVDLTALIATVPRGAVIWFIVTPALIIGLLDAKFNL